MQKKTKVDAWTCRRFAELLPKGDATSRGADIEAVLVRSKFRALAEGREQVDRGGRRRRC